MILENDLSYQDNGRAFKAKYKNNSEKYEYLIKHNPSDNWILEFKKTKEYKLLYE